MFVRAFLSITSTYIPQKRIKLNKSTPIFLVYIKSRRTICKVSTKNSSCAARPPPPPPPNTHTHTQTDRHTHRHTDTQKDTQTRREKQRETETVTERDRQRQREQQPRTVYCHRPVAPGKGKILYIIISNIYNMQ